MQHFNGLTPAEAERLALLAEELGEVQQAIGKILRHGYESRNPLQPGPTNRESLEREMGDVHCAMTLMWTAGDTDHGAVMRRAEDKAKTVMTYLHHQ